MLYYCEISALLEKRPFPRLPSGLAGVFIVIVDWFHDQASDSFYIVIANTHENPCSVKMHKACNHD